jgi:hypothetical protein
MKHVRPEYNRIQDPAGLIPDDEPVFLLRASDVFAAQTVRDWANAVERYAPKGAVRDNMVRVARNHAAAMDDWPNKKWPDMPKTITVWDPSTETREERLVDPDGNLLPTHADPQWMIDVQKQFDVSGIAYGPDETFALRKELIALRDGALAQNDFDWSVKLSHAIALFARMGEAIWPARWKILSETS